MSTASSVVALERWQPFHHSDATARAHKLVAGIDAMEANLTSQALDLGTLDELRTRHGQVTQIACKVSDEHVQEIHRLQLAQQEKLRSKHGRRRVAMGRSQPGPVAMR